MSTVESSLARRRYGEVEAAYTSRRYTQALNDGLSLLQDLEDPANQPLRMRLLLLLAHTWLYGLEDQDSAAVAYRQVAEESEEPALQEIAAEGLSRSRPSEQPVPTPTLQENADSPDHDALGARSISQEPASHAFGAAAKPEPEVLGSAAPWLRDLTPRGDQDPAYPTKRLQPEALAPFQQPQARTAATGSKADRPTSDLDLTANQADPPWQEPAKDPSGSSTPGWIANTSPSVPSSSTVTGHPMVTPSSLTRSNATIDSGAGPQTREPAIARQPSSPERNNRPAAMPEAEPLIMPSTLSFSPEEEQELAKGLLLVVLG